MQEAEVDETESRVGQVRCASLVRSSSSPRMSSPPLNYSTITSKVKSLPSPPGFAKVRITPDPFTRDSIADTTHADNNQERGVSTTTARHIRVVRSAQGAACMGRRDWPREAVTDAGVHAVHERKHDSGV